MKKEQLIELGWLVFMSVIVGFAVGVVAITTAMYAIGVDTSVTTSFVYAGVVGSVYFLTGLYKILKG